MTEPSEATTCTYRFLSSLDDHVPPTIPHILIRQQPRQAKQSIAYDRERRPVEPPPIVQIEFSNLTAQETMTCLQSPYYFMTARLVTPDSTVRQPKLCDNEEDVLTGSVVSSLHRLKDVDNQDAGFFVFGDLAIKIPGTFRIHFSLYEIRGGQVINRESIATEPFTVYSPKQFPGPLESTFLSRTFADQGVRMRIRKEHRMHSKAVPSKRKTTAEEPTTGSRKASASRLRNHSVRFVSQNSMYGGSNTVKAPRRNAAAGPAAPSTPDHHPEEAKEYHVGKFRFEREESRQPSNSPPIELLALYAERAAKELAQPKLAGGYPSPPPHHPQVKVERHRKSIPSPPLNTLPMPVRSSIPNRDLPPPTPLSVHRSASEIRLPSIRDLMDWSEFHHYLPPPQPYRPQEEEIARAMMQLASDAI
ncbi:hypothetical protein INT44_004318 [Umbelopsis vinacea]|uniref:Velvet domain-containing protein n=1 Tax=Umbelopsis vinacea TaxID=44442 RepID=A0A8H7QB70_9FUNG|nr:hypothetical protein INT44_004318 [Umbelopsis vinacea]